MGDDGNSSVKSDKENKLRVGAFDELERLTPVFDGLESEGFELSPRFCTTFGST